MSRSVVRHDETESRIAARPSHSVPLIQASPLACTAASAALVVASSAKRKSTWLSTTSLSTSQPGQLGDPRGEATRVGARALDEVGDARAAELAQRRVDRDSARTARMLGRPVDRLPDHVGLADEIHGLRGHRLTVRVGVRAEGDAAVVRDVEPLVGVGRPRVGPLRPGDEMAERRAGRGPQPERTVDVEPGARALDRVRDRDEVVEHASVHLARLRADDRRPLGGGERAAERLRDRAGRPAEPPARGSASGRCRGSAARGRSSSGASRRRAR